MCVCVCVYRVNPNLFFFIGEGPAPALRRLVPLLKVLCAARSREISASAGNHNLAGSRVLAGDSAGGIGGEGDAERETRGVIPEGGGAAELAVAALGYELLLCAGLSETPVLAACLALVRMRQSYRPGARQIRAR